MRSMITFYRILNIFIFLQIFCICIFIQSILTHLFHGYECSVFTSTDVQLVTVFIPFCRLNDRLVQLATDERHAAQSVQSCRQRKEQHVEKLNLLVHSINELQREIDGASIRINNLLFGWSQLITGFSCPEAGVYCSIRLSSATFRLIEAIALTRQISVISHCMI